MNPGIYYSALVVHVVGITLMAGTSFIDAMIFQQFWKAFPADITTSRLTENILYKLQKFLGIGMLLILLSGVTMMFYMHTVWGQQTWFRIKMGILLLIIINGLLIRRRLGASLKKLLAEMSTDTHFAANRTKLKRSITTVHLFQILFFCIIFTLSVFKFN